MVCNTVTLFECARLIFSQSARLRRPLGTRGSVYSHLVDTQKWLGVTDFNLRKPLVQGILLQGAREASKALRTYEWLSQTEGG